MNISRPFTQQYVLLTHLVTMYYMSEFVADWIYQTCLNNPIKAQYPEDDASGYLNSPSKF